jgi:hypothetical protein
MTVGFHKRWVHLVGFEVLTAASMKAAVIALTMEAASTSETSVKFYQTTLWYNLEDSHFHRLIT